MGGGVRHPCDTPMLFFSQFGEKTRQTITVNQLQTLRSILYIGNTY